MQLQVLVLIACRVYETLHVREDVICWAGVSLAVFIRVQCVQISWNVEVEVTHDEDTYRPEQALVFTAHTSLLCPEGHEIIMAQSRGFNEVRLPYPYVVPMFGRVST